MAKITSSGNLGGSASDSQKENVLNLPNYKRYYVVTDPDGNIKGYFPIKEKNLGKGWFAMYQDPALWLGQQRLTGEQYSVLFALFHQLDFNNYLRISRTEIADALQIQPVNVSRSMKVLKEKGIIFEGPPAGKFKTYRLNPYIAHKGTDRNSTIVDFESAKSKKDSDDFDD